MTKLTLADCRFLSGRAWAIRRFHAARLRVGVLDVSWRGCLLLARKEWFAAEARASVEAARAAWYGAPMVRVNPNPVCLVPASQVHRLSGAAAWGLRVVGVLALVLVGV